ncbi:MAG: PD-(D/E)XK nuclease domain-containing protein, partial [Bacteroidaceae bacterium]|nr:PD-(D/E)XK nuclease domain-containing protein [Bacteroidaceae bacterium]
IDLVLQTRDYTYVLEFKLDGTAEEALQQIQDKSYALPFETGTTRVFRIGLNFSSETRNIGKWVMG